MKYFYEGEPLYMGALTMVLTVILVVAVMNTLRLIKDKYPDVNIWKGKLDMIKSIGLFAMIMGIFIQIMGLYGAFESIEVWGSVSPQMLMGGLQVSMITTIYGFIIAIISYLIWFALRAYLSSKVENA